MCNATLCFTYSEAAVNAVLYMISGLGGGVGTPLVLPLGPSFLIFHTVFRIKMGERPPFWSLAPLVAK